MNGPHVPEARPYVTGDLLTALATRLTPRDHDILALVHEHRVLTSAQIGEVFFDGQRAANARLTILYQYRALDRARPAAPGLSGSCPYHYILGEAGALVLAADRGITRAELGYRRERAAAALLSRKLAHTTGVNGFFTALHARARRHPAAAALTAWWPEWRCAVEWNNRIHPDAYGRWRETGPAGTSETDFFLEFDRGTETLGRVAAKLADYHALHRSSSYRTPVLFWRCLATF
jgi:hypothetical protein